LRRSLLSLLTLLVAFAMVASSAVDASASRNGAAESRVRANTPAIETRVGLAHEEAADQIGRDSFVFDQTVLATGVATEAGGASSTASIDEALGCSGRRGSTASHGRNPRLIR
jgi:hypothetical protein